MTRFHRTTALVGLLILASGGVPRASTDPSRQLEARADEAMHAALAAYGVPGGVLVIVKDGSVLLAKGYGVADLDRRTPMDAATTRLPVASISKTVTATAVMQLVEQRRVNLDAPVNGLLADFQIDSPFAEPIRLRDLLTHTAGFDEGLVGLADETRQPLGRTLARNLPQLLGPPGSVWLYSNHSIALAGHVVEAVSGQTFEEYAANNIFRPLGMSSSSFARTPEGERAMARGYTGAGQNLTPWRPPRIQLTPAAALTTTGADMARFLLAHLEHDGTGGILRPETLRLMHARHFALHPNVPGMALGFFEQFHNGVRGLMHDGDWSGYSSRLVLLPDERLGVFVSFNAWRAEARTDVVRRVVTALVPPRLDDTIATAPPSADISRLTGTYWWNRYPHRGVMKVAGPKMESALTAAGDGTVEMMGLRFTPTGKDVFHQVDGPGRLTFVKSEDRVKYALLDVPFRMGPTILEPIPWYGTVRFHQSLMAVLRAVAATVVVWPVAALLHRVRRRPRNPASTLVPRVLATLGILPVLLSPFWLAAVIRDLYFGVSRVGQLLLLMPAAAALATIATGYCTLVAWRRVQGSFVVRVHYTLLWLTMLAYLWSLNYWNLLVLPPSVTG